MIPAIIYIIWISCVFQNIRFTNFIFFQKLQNHGISVGELINFLCKSSGNFYMEIILKVLSLFAIITSAIGIALGLRKPMKEMLRKSQNLSDLFICFTPVLLAIFIPDAFINILSFGGMIATIFVIFIPYFLMLRLKEARFSHHICFIVGIIIVFCEALSVIKIP